MKKVFIIGAATLLLAGCQADSKRDRALVGGGLGAATGAVIGAAAGTGAAPVLAGAAIGAAGGALIGAATTPKNCIAHDQNGRPYRVACP